MSTTEATPPPPSPFAGHIVRKVTWKDRKRARTAALMLFLMDQPSDRALAGWNPPVRQAWAMQGRGEER